nr:hypothetical protein CFP56_67632 [Quercus suber]
MFPDLILWPVNWSMTFDAKEKIFQKRQRLRGVFCSEEMEVEVEVEKLLALPARTRLTGSTATLLTCYGNAVITNNSKST